MKRWYEKPLRVFDLALEDPYGQWLDRWTAEEVVNLVREVGANVLNMMIVNEWGQAYFKARRLPLHPQLNGSDRFAEVLEQATKHGLKVTGMWGPTPNPIVYERHPDWARRSPDGQISGWGYLHLDPCVHVCHNSPYGDIVLETLEELFEGYPLAGVAFDYFLSSPCYCRCCRDKFLEESGTDIATCEDWSEQQKRRLADWAKHDAEGFVTRAAEVAHRHGRIIVGWLRTSDVLFAEPHTGGMITIKDKGFVIRETLARAYACADVCLFPSLAENYPMTVLESLASGTPVVAFDVGGIPEQIVPGQTGYVAHDGDADELTAGLVQLAGDREHARQMGLKGREFVVRNCSTKAVVERYRRVYEEAIRAWRRRRGGREPRFGRERAARWIAGRLGWEYSLAEHGPRSDTLDRARVGAAS